MLPISAALLGVSGKAMRYTLAIDPGAHTGLALFEDENFLVASTTDGSSFLSLRDAIADLIRPWPVMAHKVAVIEAGFLGVNRLTALVLERRRGFCQAASELQGFACAELYPSTWQSKALKHLGDGKQGRPKRAELKRRALEFARNIVGGPVASSDAADAICMGWVYSRGLHLPGS